MRQSRAWAVVGLFCLLAEPTFGAGFETVILKDGQRITGEVVAEKQTCPVC